MWGDHTEDPHARAQHRERAARRARNRVMLRRAVAAASVLVASFLAVLVAVAGMKVIAAATAPVFFGQSFSGDQTYPDGTKALAGAFVVVFGMVLAGAVLGAQRRSRPHQLVGAACLLLLALGMAANAQQHADQTRCVTDTYLETEHCVGHAWAAARQMLTTSLPTALAALGLLSIRAIPRSSTT